MITLLNYGRAAIKFSLRDCKMKNFEQKIFNYLAARLSPKRFEHSCNVAKLSVELASIYGVDVLKAQTAGLLHDCAKSMTEKALISFCVRKRVKTPNFKALVKYAPQLLHSFAGEIIAKENFDIKDRDLLNAVRNHTLGRPEMSMLEKILFTADAVSYDRKFPFSAKTRKLAKTDFNAAFKAVMRAKMEYVLNKGVWLCPKALETWNFYAV
ncbi:MAG: bis(5'-nucleosyl)-tetraphosphatase (symmetrical) YqeK [Endomicrobium sp.]|jgi:predicted HD superfamily hydrolase involved in NAD metabolism|nr:bis(5'-nucleosyl)-tetraphosphatase (symmetrical) YqeK [Endomicrobium sp.]